LTHPPPLPPSLPREFTTWTDLNTIVYHGSAEDRAINRDYEWWFDEGKEGGKKGSSGSKVSVWRGGRGGREKERDGK